MKTARKIVVTLMLLPLICVAQQNLDSVNVQDSIAYIWDQYSHAIDCLNSKSYEECIIYSEAIVNSTILDEASQHQVLFNLGISYVNIGKSDKALPFLEKACAMKDYTIPSESFVLSFCYSSVGRFKEAISVRNNFLNYTKNENDKETQLLYAQALGENALDYIELNDYQKAIDYQKQCWEAHSRMNENDLALNDLYYLTLYRAMSGCYDEVQLINELNELYLESESVKDKIGIARSISLLVDDRVVSQLDSSLQKHFYYILGLAKYGKEDFLSAQSYFEKVNELFINENLYDSDHLNAILFLCDSYMATGNYVVLQKYLTKAIVRYVNQFESKPQYALDLYTRLAHVYEAVGDTLWSDRVHVEKIQYYLIKDYVNSHPNDSIGEQILKDFNNFRFVEDQYNNLQDIRDEHYVARAEFEADNLVKIGANDEAEWCYQYCIRLSSRYSKGFSESSMFAYMNLLRLYAEQNIERFNVLFPKAIEYAERDPSKYYNEFYISQIFGNIFFEKGDNQQAYTLYKRCVSYLDSGNHIENEIEHKISVYRLLMAICDDLGYYQEALNYHPFLESQLTKEDGEKYYNYKFNLFAALMGIEDYNTSLPVIEELVQFKLSLNDTLNQKYIEYCLLKGANLIQLNKDIEAKSIFNGLYDCLQSHSNDIVDLQGWVYSSLASGLMELGDYQKALTMLEKSAEVELNEYGQVSNSILNNISECRKHL